MPSLCLRAAVLLGVAALGLSPAGAHGQPNQPPSLAGETLVGSIFKEDTQASCFPASLRFRLQGLAAGPYPGTFVEEGTATYQDNLTLLDFQTRFEINSPVGHVQGTKRLITPMNVGCFFVGEINSLIALMQYEATITTPQGEFTESGEATVALAACDRNHPTCPSGSFNESFLTSSGLFPVDNGEDDDDDGEDDKDDNDHGEDDDDDEDDNDDGEDDDDD